MNRELAPLLRTHPRWIEPDRRGGLSTRVGFPAADAGADGAEDPSRATSRQILARALGVDPGRMAWARQVHGRGVLEVNHPGLQGEADALVSGDPAHVLLVSVADCGPVLLADSGGPAFGVVHAGWRGTVGGILEAAVDALAGLGAPAARLRAWIGPCIGPDHFEVGEEVAAAFAPAHVRAARPPDRLRPHVDLPAEIAARLVAAGLPPQAIDRCGDCTYTRADLYWSYRRDGGICGRHLGYLTRS